MCSLLMRYILFFLSDFFGQIMESRLVMPNNYRALSSN